jgi:release factor glutamine methyltransferase
MSTLRQHLEAARKRLSSQPAPSLEAEILLAYSLESPRSFLYAHPEMELPPQRSRAFRALLDRRVSGEPIAYITGQREFWSLSLDVTPDVLIPRAETELLVETALQIIPAAQSWRLADLGTGSGAIALALASERAQCEVHGVDASESALAVARGNAVKLGLERVRFHLGSWSEPLQGQFEVIASNPPYVAQDDPHLDRGDCRFEPRQALTPGKDPLAAIRAIAEQSREKLARNGWLLLEHGPEQGDAVRRVLEQSGLSGANTLRDLLGHERVTLGCMTR